jgi:hypothetical protein
MKIKLTALLISTFMCLVAGANDSLPSEGPKKHRLNFFIISRPKKGKFDGASRFNILRTRVRSLFQKEKFVSIVAYSAEQVSRKMMKRLHKGKYEIGTLWFDSHGKYKKGHSLFYLGHDEFNYISIKDTVKNRALRVLTPYCSTSTQVVIGSCYGGATFKRGFAHSGDSMRMNGDSLMIGLSNVLHQATVYGSESWVLTKPGLFHGTSAVAGYPLRKLFRDEVYRPAWEKIGKWNVYAPGLDGVVTIPPVSLDKQGNLLVQNKAYQDKKKIRRKIRRKLKSLEDGLVKE